MEERALLSIAPLTLDEVRTSLAGASFTGATIVTHGFQLTNSGGDSLLPLAQERKIAVLAYFPFDRNRIFPRAGTTPLPEWAADFDAKTWAQFFLKYVISHPAVTVARAGTSNPEHMLDNLGGGIGRLPDEATRKRMAELVDSWPQTERGRG